MGPKMECIYLMMVFISLSLSVVHGQDFLVCYSCKNVQHPDNCTDVHICNQGESCHTIQIVDTSETYYNMGCESKQTCDHISSLIFGKREIITGDRSSRAKIPQCASCCNSSGCNNKLCPITTTTITTTSTTTDATTRLLTSSVLCQDHAECTYLLRHFAVCNDNDSAINLCPKSCGHCTTTPMTTKACLDKSQICAYLQTHLHVCSDPLSVEKFGCFKTCNMCNGVQTHTTVNTMTTVSSSSKPTSPQHIKHTCNKGTSFHFMLLSNNDVVTNDQLLIVSEYDVKLDILQSQYHLNITKNISKFSEIDISSAIQQTPHKIENKSVQVRASSEISLFVLNVEDYSTDIFNALNDDCLGNDYVLSTYIDPSITKGDVLVFVSALALENTSVRIRLKLDISFAYVELHNRRYHNGDTITIDLVENETFELKSEYDLTGSQIQSSRKIAVTAGSDCAVIGRGSCSHIESMYPPTHGLSDTYVIPTLKDRTGGIVRVVSTSNDKTVVNTTISGHSQTHQIPAHGYIQLNMADNPVFLSCSHKVLVTLYAKGKSDYSGDPFSMFIPGMEQYLSDYRFATPSVGFDNYVTVIIKRSEYNGLMLDERRFSTSTHADISLDGQTYTVRASVTSGHHHIKHSTGQPFGLFVYGNGPSDGYGYPAGFSIEL